MSYRSVENFKFTEEDRYVEDGSIYQFIQFSFVERITLLPTCLIYSRK
jgi:hypothetical protein